MRKFTEKTSQRSQFPEVLGHGMSESSLENLKRKNPERASAGVCLVLMTYAGRFRLKFTPSRWMFRAFRCMYIDETIVAFPQCQL